MKVIVDTSVWSMALRRKSKLNTEYHTLLQELIEDGRVVMLGCIRQEILSGINDLRQFHQLRDHLRAFSDLKASEQDYENAAACFSQCRKVGIRGSNTDFLICALSIKYRLAILTTDKDFNAYAKILPIKLFK